VGFRKSIDGLAALVALDIKVAVFDPVLFVFLNRPRNRVKILYFRATLDAYFGDLYSRLCRLSRSLFIMMLRLLTFLLLLIFLVGSTQAHAFETNSCAEYWYSRAPTFEQSVPFAFYTRERGFKLEHVEKCQPRQADMRGPLFSVFEGQAFYVERSVNSDEPHCGQRSRGGVNIDSDLRCYLPHWLWRVKKETSISYFPIFIHGNEFRLLDVPKPGQSDWEIERASRYATDGVSVFHYVDDYAPDIEVSGPQIFVVQGADPTTFHSFSPNGVSKYERDWAQDAKHFFYGGKMISGVSSTDSLRFFGDNLVAIGDQVFGFNYRGIEPRPEVRPTLKMLSPDFISDGKHIYLRSGALAEGFHPNNFRLLQPVCPVPGYPDLKCVVEDLHVSDFSQAHVGVGYGGLLFDTGPAPYRIADVDPNDALYFKTETLDGIFYMAISGHRLYLLQSSSRAQYPFRGREFFGSLKGPDTDGYMTDDRDRFWVHSSSWK
jgi:hypothetical protein